MNSMDKKVIHRITPFPPAPSAGGKGGWEGLRDVIYIHSKKRYQGIK